MDKYTIYFLLNLVVYISIYIYKEMKKPLLNPKNRSFKNCENYLEAIKKKDPEYYDKFYFANRSRNTYCRPTCKSRKWEFVISNIDNYTWFKTDDEATNLGYIRCKRCEKVPPDIRNFFCESIATKYCLENGKAMTLELLQYELEKQTGIECSKFHLHRDFSASMKKKNKDHYSLASWQNNVILKKMGMKFNEFIIITIAFFFFSFTKPIK